MCQLASSESQLTARRGKLSRSPRRRAYLHSTAAQLHSKTPAYWHVSVCVCIYARKNAQKQEGEILASCIYTGLCVYNYCVIIASFIPFFSLFPCSSGQKLNCGRRFHRRKGRRIRTRWILHQSHGCVSPSKLNVGAELLKSYLSPNK